MVTFMNEHDRFIPFTSDYGFKVTFGNESNTVFLRKALQALINSTIPIKEVTFDKTTFDGVTRDGRSGVYDLMCIDEAGNHFIVEMQLNEFKYFIQRMKFYGWQKFNTLVKKGDFDYANLNKIYCIGILGENLYPWEHYHNLGCLKNQYGAIMDDQIQFITIELDKFHQKVEDCKTDLEKLIFTMKMLNVIDEPTQYPQFWTEEWLKIALHELDTRYMTPDQRMHFEITLSNNAIAVRMEKERVEKASAIAREEGMNKGILEGTIKGINEGKIEGKIESKIEIAHMMKTNGEPLEKIKAYTGLSEDEINAL
jgi:predicted transposase/invertase (TIGR01784 family)